MRYLSVCSGIEAASVAWRPLGWECVGVAEIEKFPSAVLAHHYPNVPNFGDLTRYQEWPDDLAPDLIVGGTPCQSFSVAGLRQGMADPRGNLALVFLGLVDRYRPRWVLWENVPGVRSSAGGRDFGAFLGALGELGYGWAYRSLDAQYFGLAQRRERVFVVGCLGDWRAPAAVLLEPQSLCGDSAPRRASREDLATTLAARTRSGSGYGPDTETPVIAFAPDVSPAMKARDSKGPSSDGDGDGLPLVAMVAHSLRAEGFDASEDGTGRGTPLVPIAFSAKDHGADAGEVSPTLRSMGHASSHPNGGGQVAVAFDTTQITSPKNYSNPQHGDPCHPLAARAHVPAVAFANSAGDTALGYSVEHVPPITRRNGDPGNVVTATMAVRRLTPRECERLQGFPDDYTLIPYRNGVSADGPRYKALGNSMAVPVMRWIGRRIVAMDAILAEFEVRAAA